ATAAETRASTQEHIDEYDNQVGRISDRWERYLGVAAATEADVEAHELYTTAWTTWIAATEALRDNAAVGEDGKTALLRQSQEAFRVVRSAIHEIEETLVEPRIEAGVIQVGDNGSRFRFELGGLFLLGLIFGIGSSAATIRAVRYGDRQRGAETKARHFQRALSQSLDMALTEDDALATVGLVLSSELTEWNGEMLLADSSRAHLATAVAVQPNDKRPGCNVMQPSDCAAVRRGTSLVFEDSGAFWACPYLRDRPGLERCSAACVPVSITGQTVGVLHATGLADEPPTSPVVATLEAIGSQTGDRLGVIRAFAQSQSQAATDPLTGLRNRRSFENEASKRFHRESRSVVAYGDIDHFKRLNDSHGHDSGDRALRILAKAFQSAVRDTDLIARWGGEEFVIFFSESSVTDAVQSLKRVRESLQKMLAEGTTPPFTISFGVAGSGSAIDFDELVGHADQALLEAKRAGRDRITTWTSWDGDAPGAEIIDSSIPTPDSVSTLTE
ncbi:MAG: GGDEF domain-containing protein, partial [Actinomycetia bacterium]|nr:GGDEF domain-containing protein [Actinomycetes bacterium]